MSKVDKIELTKNEVDQIQLRNSFIQNRVNQINVLNSEIQIFRREGSLFLNELLAKYGQAGDWELKDNALVRIKNAENQGTDPDQKG